MGREIHDLVSWIHHSSKLIDLGLYHIVYITMEVHNVSIDQEKFFELEGYFQW